MAKLSMLLLFLVVCSSFARAEEKVIFIQTTEELNRLIGPNPAAAKQDKLIARSIMLKGKPVQRSFKAVPYFETSFGEQFRMGGGNWPLILLPDGETHGPEIMIIADLYWSPPAKPRPPEATPIAAPIVMKGAKGGAALRNFRIIMDLEALREMDQRYLDMLVPPDLGELPDLE